MTRRPKIHQPLAHSFGEVITAIADERKPDKRTIAARPFLKWVGGKRSVLPELIKRLPKRYGTYREPFLGGGALYFAIQSEKAYLSDLNLHLVIAFQAVRDNVDQVIKHLKTHAANHGKKYYLQMRERLSTEKEPAKIAALLIYLNKTCYNGLYRVNKAGKFNVPIGDYKDPPILDEENLRNDSLVLKGAKISQHDFTQTPVVSGDFYYLDPPYYEAYDGYNGGGFGDEEHRALADFCRLIDQTGGSFMVSNSDADFIHLLYRGFTIEKVSASRFVSCKAKQRGKETELIIRNYQ